MTVTTSFRTTAATVPTPAARNEDLLLTGPQFALVIDGATAEPGADTGCQHDVHWFVADLGGRLGHALLTDPEGRHPARELLLGVLTELADEHGRTCDLDNPCSPSATLALLRLCGGDTVEHLVLGDSTVVLEHADGDVQAITDDRLDRLIHLPWAELRAHRNRPGGFWVAGARPEAAEHALTGSVPADDVPTAAVLTDGATRAVERYGRSWSEVLDLLRDEGPTALISQVRARERGTAPGRFPGKHHDDATAVLCRLERTP